MTHISHTSVAPFSQSGQRFDQVASELFPQYSRARLQGWIKSGELTLNGRAVKTNARLVGGETLALEASVEEQGEWQAEAIALDIVHEDDAIMVINKPAGLVVHPAAGNYNGTLLNALLHHQPELAKLPRAGIVHRLDKDTSGLMVVAKTLESQTSLVQQMQARAVSREYEAVAQGAILASGKVVAAIGRDPKNRKKMAALRHGGKEAVTHYTVAERFRNFTRLQLKLETGRTHQIRVHMGHIRHPLVGDPVYGGRLGKTSQIDPQLMELIKGFPRQALHAARLAFAHPLSGDVLSWTAATPPDMAALIEAIRQYEGSR